MSVFKRQVLLCIIGCIAGMGVWPLAEIILLYQSQFPSYLVFSIVFGVLVGATMCAFFSVSDKIIISRKARILVGILQGALLGIIGGIIGFLVGQAALFLIGELFIHSTRYFNLIGFPLSRALGWAILGIFVGIIDGIRSRSKDKIKIGIWGGLAGGFIGGLCLEYIRLVIPNMIYARFIGLVIFGTMIGFFYSLVENRLSYGALRLLNGALGKTDFLINQRKMYIGSSPKNDISLPGYSWVNDFHADVYIQATEVFIKGHGPGDKIWVNDEEVVESYLQYGDVLKVGTAKFLYTFA